MEWLGRLASHFLPGRKSAGPARGPLRRRLRAGYDASKTTEENTKHWQDADGLSANAALDPGTRRIMRERARHERDNNTYGGRLVEQIAVDLIGTGPRLQLSIPGVAREVSRAIESAWANWSRVADLAEDLRLMEMARLTDGEGFAVLIDNPVLVEAGLTLVQLDLQLYETDQVSDPWDYGFDPLYTDGVRRDAHGNPTEYTFLEHHPGSVYPFNALKTRKIPARSVIHWFKPLRPGQARGVSVLAKALPIFSQLRRYTLATLSAAELAAMLAGVMSTDRAADDGGAVSVDAMDEIELVRGALLTLPEGWDAKQFEPKQPVSGYREFKHELLAEAAGAANTPRNVATGDSSAYNYSSGRLDHLPYQRVIRVDRARLRARVLDRVLAQWVQEATLAGVIPSPLPQLSAWSWEWHYDGFDSIDPLKDAQADAAELAAGTVTYSEIFARRGLDWEEQLRQRAREQEMLAELGVDGPTRAPKLPTAEQANQEEGATEQSPGEADEEREAGGEQGGDESPEAGPGGEAEQAAAGAETVSDTAMNGAQVQALLMISQQVAAGVFPPEAGVALVQVAFPLAPTATVRRLMEVLGEAGANQPPAAAEAPAEAPVEVFPDAP